MNLEWDPQPPNEWHLCNGLTLVGWIEYSKFRPEGYQYIAWLSVPNDRVNMGFFGSLSEAKRALRAYAVRAVQHG